LKWVAARLAEGGFRQKGLLMMHSREEQRGPSEPARVASEVAEASIGRYLTDGTHLYRDLGQLDDVPEQVLLEDCHSLAVTPVTRDEARRLTPVTPAAGPRPHAVTRIVLEPARDRTPSPG
jgi:hypothetical protein